MLLSVSWRSRWRMRWRNDVSWPSSAVEAVCLNAGFTGVGRGIWSFMAIYGNSGWLVSLCNKRANELVLHLRFEWYFACSRFQICRSARLLLQSAGIDPAEQHKLAAHLGMSPWDKFRFVEWPRLRQQLPHVGGLVLCSVLLSFATDGVGRWAEIHHH